MSFDDRALARAVLTVCVTLEDGLASWFAATQSLLVGLTGWIYWLSARAHHETKRRRAGWLLVAGFFAYMAIDDGVQLHERLGTTRHAAARE